MYKYSVETRFPVETRFYLGSYILAGYTCRQAEPVEIE
jgi:hypothetical protein